MKSYQIMAFLCLVLLSSCGQKKTSAQKEADLAKTETKQTNDWVSLFNGANLEGWTMKIKGYPLGENFGNTFRVADGILSIRYDAYGANFDDRFGALYYDQKLSNYRLKVEYRFVGETAPGAPDWGYRDSGVQFHGQAPASIGLDQSFPVCLEYNLHGGNGTDERPMGQICANGMFVEINGTKNSSYCTPPTTNKTFHGDQWVTLEIDVKDGNITHFVNGVKILHYGNPSFDPNHEISKTLIKDGDTLVKEGYISLQSNSHPIDFRSIELLAY
ncbi:MAG: DUF1080 domain-containing protein [Maribacter sp.]|nr:DUF1080 domain-containing protein [Maribacter sp.]